MKFVVTILVDGSGKCVGGLRAGKYVRIYTANDMYDLAGKLRENAIFGQDVLEINIQQATEVDTE